jgi:hypothetical protein
VIKEVTLFVQPFKSVPITVYVVVEEGFALTSSKFVADNPEDGDHAYVLAPLAINETAEPPGRQIKPEVGLIATAGSALMVRTEEALTTVLPQEEVTTTS